MSNRAKATTRDPYEAENDDYLASSDFNNDRTYAYEPGSMGFTMGMPPQREEVGFDDPMQPPVSESTQQRAQQEREAADRSNILAGKGRRLRSAKPQAATGYNEGPIGDDMPDESLEAGKSSTRYDA